MTAQPQLQLVAREYLRVSADASGRQVSTEQQAQDNRDQAADAGWLLGAPYCEAGAISASRYSRKTRAGFQDLIADLESGSFGADVLIMWAASRASRRGWEWARLIEALAAAGVRLFITSDDRLYNPANYKDRKSLRDSASDAEYVSDEISNQVGRAMRAEAQAGKPHGRKVYGYDREYQLDPGGQVPAGWYRLDSTSPAMIARQVPNPAEAAAVRLVFASLLAGESMRSIAAALSGEGPRPAMGEALATAAVSYAGRPAPGSWPATRVRDIALNPAYAGKRLHVAGSHLAASRQAYSLADLADGNWPALVSWADWCTVAEKVRSNKRTSKQPGRQPAHLLSMIASCAVCGGPLAVRYKHASGRATYLCQRGGHVSISRDELDALVTAAVQQRLSAADTYPALAPADSLELQQARQAEAAVRAELADLAAQLAAGKISATLAGAAEPAILARIETAAARVRQLQSPGQLSSLGLAPGADIFARWTAAPLTARRDAIRALFASITVTPAGRHSQAPVADRLSITWRQS